MTTKKLLDMLETLKQSINENRNPDGTCAFDGELVMNMLEITLRMVEKSSDND